MAEVMFRETEGAFVPALKERLASVFSAGDSVAVKLHMGEKKNLHHLKPAFVKTIVDAMKGLGLRPFLFDSPVSYKGARHTAEDYSKLADSKGFSEGGMGCPVVVSNESVEVKKDSMVYGVCRPLAEADGVLVLSHVKGHMCSGFGGAVKNLGMGALTRETKTAIHEGGEPKYASGCTVCRACEKACPTKNVRFADERPYFDKSWCCGCSACVYACPENAIKAKVGPFDALLAEGAAAAAGLFKRSFYVSVMREITRYCDCMSDPGEIVCKDLGMLLSSDGVAIDAASLDMINKSVQKNVFLELNRKDPHVQVKKAEEYGMGAAEYELVPSTS